MAAAENASDNSENIPSNLLTLRRRLMMTQQEFLNAYLRESGKPIVSVATLSNIERGGAGNAGRVVDKLSATMGVAVDLFGMEPDSFAKNIDLFFSRQLAQGEENMVGRINEVRRTSNVEMLVRSLSDYLMDAMMSGKLKTGDMLPSDRQLSATFGVGRTPIREALKVLSILGLIQIFPGKGTFIASQNTDLFFAPLSWSFLLGQSSTTQIVDVRNVLEVESARLAACNATHEQLDDLTRVFDQMRVAYTKSNFQAFLDMDIDFHLAVAKCSANAIILNLLTTSRKLLTYISKSGISTVTTIQAIYEEHEAIFGAIRKKNSAQSQKAMEQHLKNARERYNLLQNPRPA